MRGSHRRAIAYQGADARRPLRDEEGGGAVSATAPLRSIFAKERTSPKARKGATNACTYLTTHCPFVLLLS